MSDADQFQGGAPVVHHQGAQFSHPVPLFFHVFFRAAAIITYVLCSWFSNNFVMNFILIVLLLSFDFWTVKNVTGRLLVGLRWWNHVRPDGSSKWVFESKKEGHSVNALESTIFWSTLYATPLVWGIFFLAALVGLKFAWMTIVVVALMLNIAQVIGYNKCQQDAKTRLQTLGSNFITSNFVSQAVSSFGGMAAKSATPPV